MARLRREILDSVQQGLKAKNGNDADFWSVVGAIELRQYKALAARKLASEGGPLRGPIRICTGG